MKWIRVIPLLRNLHHKRLIKLDNPKKIKKRKVNKIFKLNLELTKYKPKSQKLNLLLDLKKKSNNQTYLQIRIPIFSMHTIHSTTP